MSGVLFDLCASARYLRQRPLLVLIAVGTLGIGVGVASALFAVIDALYVRPLPLDPGKEVVVVRALHGADESSVSRADMNDLLARAPVAAYGGTRDWGFTLVTDTGREPVDGALATAGLFEVFRIRPHLGRLLRADDERAVVVSWAAWKGRFAGDPAIVGRPITLGDDLFTIVGVLPEHFVAPSFREAEIWAPLTYDTDYRRGRDFRNLTVYARIAPPHDLRALRGNLITAARALEQRYPETNRGWSARAVPLIEFELGPVARQLLLLSVAAALLLAIALTNLATTIFSESMSRRREYGIRAAIGGSTLRLYRQLLFDNLLLCLVGGAVAVVLAFALVSLAVPRYGAAIPRVGEVAANSRVVFFALLVSSAAAALFALLSLWWSGRGEPAEHIRASSRSLVGAARLGGGTLVAVQVTLAVILVALGIRFAASYHARATADRGFDPDSLLLVRVKAAEAMNRNERVRAAADAVTDLVATPGVEAAAIASSGPMFGPGEEIETAPDAVSPHSMMRYANVDGGFFAAMRIRLVAGRTFDDGDRGTPPVVILSRSAAARFFPGADAVGKQLWLGAPKRRPHQVVGIVADVSDTRGDRGGGMDVYLPFAADPRALFFIVGRGIFPARVEPPPRLMIVSTRRMDAILDEHLLLPGLQTALLAIFALGAAILTTVAVYGMVALVTGARRDEIGIRLALGATPWQAELLLFRAILTPVITGLIAGCILLDRARDRIDPLLDARATTAWPVTIAVVFVVAVTIGSSLRSVRETARVVS